MKRWRHFIVVVGIIPSVIIYVSLFGKPKDGKWDEKKIKLIEQSLKEYEKN